MSGTATAPPASLFAAEAVETRCGTLEDEVLAAWRELRLGGSTPCLVCGATVEADGVCGACGSELT